MLGQSNRVRGVNLHGCSLYRDLDGCTCRSLLGGGRNLSPRTSWAIADRRRSVGRFQINIGTRVRKHNVLCFQCSTAISDIGDKHGRALAERCRSLACSCFDGDGGAVHVHLAVTNLVEPSPGKYRISSGCVDRKSECKIGRGRNRAVSNP